MAVRAMNTYSIFRSVPSPPLAALGSCLHHFTASQWRPHAKIGFRLPNFRSGQAGLLGYGSVRSYSSESLVESVMEELGSLRKRKRICASAKVGLTNSGELLEDKLERKALQKGLLLEFKKDSERVLLAVAQRPDGKKNWMVSDQNGVTTSIKPQQVTFIVPGAENFDHKEISDFIEKAQNNLDPSLLEYAWVELLEKNKSVTVMDLAEMIFGSAEPLESYCAHLLLSKDEIYFTVLESKGSFSFYGPRPASQVEELLRRKLAKETAEREFEEFVQLLKSAKSMPPHAKPSKSSWEVEENIRNRIKSLENYAIDACENGEQKKTAGMILRALGLSKTSASALNLLIVIGYFPVHVNLDLLKFNIRTDHSDEIISAAECLLSGSSDPDEDQGTGRTIGVGCELQGHYHLAMLMACTSAASLNLLHSRLGHSSLSKLKKLVPSLSSLFIFDCESCQRGKHARSSFSSCVNNRVEAPFSLVQSDVWGPSRVNSTHGFSYFVTFIHNFSRCTWLFLMKSRSELFSVFQTFTAEIKTQFEVSIRTLRSDNAHEYFSSQFTTFITTRGILHQSSCPYIPQQNGVAERKNRHLIEIARTLLLHANLPTKFWGDAVLTACYLINRMPSSVLKDNIPHSLLFPSQPFYSVPLRVFGCICFMHSF
ncbi:ribonuclease II, chloroplastic/mitochondrial isoform X3 [Diospyros lotus]|uniref:ribonuclease II, chloroplastic/mitochondrial isoform X3 n=1 Tax=Diospyros lotus TaxID=55363 RepID=UPI0022548C48|nr:ribonuclease II, chloroplastic/mitochondrial isoform X3 [Diospyros lotus]